VVEGGAAAVQFNGRAWAAVEGSAIGPTWAAGWQTARLARVLPTFQPIDQESAVELPNCPPIDRAAGWVHGLQSANVRESAAVPASPRSHQIDPIWAAEEASAIGRAFPSFLPESRAAQSVRGSRIALAIDPRHYPDWATVVPANVQQTVHSRIGGRDFRTD
jgi:hypothetical protein